MSDNQESKKIAKATSWSFLTQVVARLIPPISNMILARFFAPEVFGAIATITMVTSFAETFSEAGFSKYLIAAKYEDKDTLAKDADVAFWTHMSLSMLLWVLIVVFRRGLAGLLGNPEIQIGLCVASLQLPLSALSSVQSALYQKEYDFKKLCVVQIASSVANLAITLVLATQNMGYWAIVVGNLSGCVIRVILLSIRGNWMPRFFYSFARLKKIFSFSMWIMGEGIAVWLTSWFDSFTIGNALNEHNLGIYKNSQSVVNGVLSIPQNAVTNVLMVSLSRKTDDQAGFRKEFLQFQRLLAYVLIPMAAGIVLYRQLAVSIVFGSGWEDAEFVIALWASASIVRILLVSMNSAAYIATGKTRLSLWLQLIDMAILIPACIFGVRLGFEKFVILRCIIRLDIVIPSLIFMHKFFRIYAWDILKNMGKPLCGTAVMVAAALLLQRVSQSMLWSVCSIVICVLIYAGVLLVIAKDDVGQLLALMKKKKG